MKRPNDVAQGHKYIEERNVLRMWPHGKSVDMLPTGHRFEAHEEDIPPLRGKISDLTHHMWRESACEVSRLVWRAKPLRYRVLTKKQKKERKEILSALTWSIYLTCKRKKKDKTFFYHISEIEKKISIFVMCSWIFGKSQSKVAYVTLRMLRR